MESPKVTKQSWNDTTAVSRITGLSAANIYADEHGHRGAMKGVLS